MIIHATAETMKLYRLNPPEKLPAHVAPITMSIIARDCGDPLRQWGMKCFAFGENNCLQTVNFASKLTLFLFDIKLSNLDQLGVMMANYLFNLYEADDAMTACIHRMFQEDHSIAFAPLKNRSILSTLNNTQVDFAMDGCAFRRYIDSRNILHTIQINRDVNFNYLFTHKAAGKKDFYYPGEFFRELVLSRYG